MSPAKNKEDSSKKNQSLSHSKGVVIPIDKLANHSQAANILTTAIVSLAIGFFGGRGYEKSQTP